MANAKIALLYERLSRDDELCGESFSIQNHFNDFTSAFQSQPPFHNSGRTRRLSLHNCRKCFSIGFPVTLL